MIAQLGEQRLVHLGLLAAELCLTAEETLFLVRRVLKLPIMRAGRAAYVLAWALERRVFDFYWPNSTLAEFLAAGDWYRDATARQLTGRLRKLCTRKQIGEACRKRSPRIASRKSQFPGQLGQSKRTRQPTST